MTLEEWRSIPITQELIGYLQNIVADYKAQWVLGTLNENPKAQPYAAAHNDILDSIKVGSFIVNRESENDNQS